MNCSCPDWIVPCKHLGAGRDITLFESDILLTSYGSAPFGLSILRKQKWQVMVIDETQYIKNLSAASNVIHYDF